MARKLKSTKLHIGCGVKKRQGWINLDYNSEYKPDIVADVSKGIPLPDNSMDEIDAFHVVEHIENITDFILECFRVAKDGCIIRIKYPHFSTRSAYADPTHRHYLNHYSLEYFSNDHLNEETKIFPNYLNLQLVTKEAKCFFFSIRNRMLIEIFENLRIPIQEICVVFKAVKK